jgi:multimeric flavodoxin WrbA
MKKLFVYYSHSGNGDVVADYLKEKGFDIRKVIPKKDIPKSFALSILVGGFKASVNYHDKLKDFNYDISDYDEIYIGSPIWNARLSSPINTIMDKLEVEKRPLTFVLYSGSGTSPKATIKIKEKFPEAKIIDLKDPKKNKKELIKL